MFSHWLYITCWSRRDLQQYSWRFDIQEFDPTMDFASASSGDFDRDGQLHGDANNLLPAPRLQPSSVESLLSVLQAHAPTWAQHRPKTAPPISTTSTPTTTTTTHHNNNNNHNHHHQQQQQHHHHHHQQQHHCNRSGQTGFRFTRSGPVPKGRLEAAPGDLCREERIS